jgi:hypothetical protein
MGPKPVFSVKRDCASRHAARAGAGCCVGLVADGYRYAAPKHHLFSAPLGQLHHCLQHRQTFDEAKASPHGVATPRPNGQPAVGLLLGTSTWHAILRHSRRP